MAVYVVALIEVADPTAYAEYQRHGLPTVAAAGGRVVAGGPSVTLEGEDLPDRSAVVEFPTMEAALSWYRSEQYQSTIPMRRAASKAVTIAVLPGVAPDR